MIYVSQILYNYPFSKKLTEIHKFNYRFSWQSNTKKGIRKKKTAVCMK